MATVLAEQFHDVRSTLNRRHLQKRIAFAVLRIHFGLVHQKQFHHVLVVTIVILREMEVLQLIAEGTHFVLDCFRSEQLERLVGRLAEAVMPEARWLLSDFCEPPARLAKWRARLILEAMYLFFGWTTGLSADRLTAPGPLLVRRGFVLRQRHLFEWGLLHADLWDLQPPGVIVSPEIGNEDVGFKV